MFPIAYRRAVSTASSPRDCAIDLNAVLYWTIAFVLQNLAMSVCSAVRAVLFEPPIDLTSLNISAHSGLVRAGNGAGRNCSALSRVNGRIFATHGVCGP